MNKNAAEFKKKKKRFGNSLFSLNGMVSEYIENSYISVLGLDVTVINKWPAI